MIYLLLVWNFFKTGLFSVGGGLATLPFLYEMSDRTGWFSHADIADMIAVSESTPGAIGINMSTFAGFLTGGVPGGFAATIGLALPSFIIIIIISRLLRKFKDNKYVEYAFYGLRPASIAMISAAGLNVARIALVRMGALSDGGGALRFFNFPAILLAVCIYFGQKKWKKIHPVAFIAASALVGIVFRFGGAV